MFVRGINVSGDFLDTVQQPYCGQSGSVHWNNASNKLTIHNGECGHDVYPVTPFISLTDENSRALAWVKQKMMEEKQLLDLCDKYPGLKDAYEHFQTMHQLCK